MGWGGRGQGTGQEEKRPGYKQMYGVNLDWIPVLGVIKESFEFCGYVNHTTINLIFKEESLGQYRDYLQIISPNKQKLGGARIGRQL